MRATIAVALAALVAGCAAGGTNLSAVPELRPGVPAGYLATDARPDSLKLLPAPPAQGSAALALDEDAARQAGTLRGSPRWQVAGEDAVLTFPQAASAFSCALGVPVSEKETPYLNILLRRSLVDAGLSTYKAKDHYKRTRPFVANKTQMCTPAETAKLEKDGSYPSGHSAIGWAWALILAEVEPERANDILARGRAFGQSRVVCNVHWQSDVNEGRMMAAATVARLHADPTFRADLDRARREVAAARASGARPSRDCQAESAALAP
ncbi:phosphatase PAP2 family protein [Cupriavidus necator H16]|uniref:Acid phosphatase n=1 Tax=Cupriavidus necator (strain ATCC 17699 / DSM 428 / KCTC 22496 / NCIMB 10442 / H16 / Stanier 337) TaxID=381666 RepID=A0AAF1D506_CUPNH|nr:acid phosphatase [Cupriavidus necator]QCC05200.1 phosphatase PAP2 family protein [Cupriavidus necator H16]QQB81155.1 phosphatase PAP2 family protein [Cupriavidus necator]